ncbi:ATP-grasp fold amidoligase family protein [Chlorobium limicola]
MIYIFIIFKEFFRSANWFIFFTREKITHFGKEKKRFHTKLKYQLDINNPKSLNHKIVWKKLYDRNPLLTITSDKYKVREYVRLILGDKTANEILVPLLYVGNDPTKIPFQRLPEEYVIKTNHASKTNILIDRKHPAEINLLTKQLHHWLTKPYGLFAYEWAYQKIKRLVIIEKFLRDSFGKPPKDYKFLMIHGKCELIQVYTNREDELSCSFYDTDWNHQDIQWKNTYGPVIEKPEMLQKMIDISEKLSAPFDFVRVDLYTLDGRIFFGELTHYPASGRLELSPISVDFFLGSKWINKKYYWKDNNNPSINIYKKCTNSLFCNK